MLSSSRKIENPYSWSGFMAYKIQNFKKFTKKKSDNLIKKRGSEFSLS